MKGLVFTTSYSLCEEYYGADLLPDLPSFNIESCNDQTLTLRYYSCKPLADLAAGVIKGAAAHSDEGIKINHRPGTNDRGAHVRFEITQVA